MWEQQGGAGASCHRMLTHDVDDDAKHDDIGGFVPKDVDDIEGFVPQDVDDVGCFVPQDVDDVRCFVFHACVCTHGAMCSRVGKSDLPANVYFYTLKINKIGRRLDTSRFWWAFLPIFQALQKGQKVLVNCLNGKHRSFMSAAAAAAAVGLGFRV